MPGTSLAVHWLRLCFHCRGQFPSLVWELRSHKPCNMARERERNRCQSFEIPCRFCHLEGERFVTIAVGVATVASHLCLHMIRSSN